MSSGFKSFNLSLVFHAMIVVVISLFISKKENIEMIESKRFITMSLGSFGSAPSGSPAKKSEASAHATKKTIESEKRVSLSNSVSATTVSQEAPVGITGTAASNGNGLGTGSGVGAGSGGAQDFNSSVLNYSEPIYPRMALRRGLEGSLRVRIKINSQGIPEETTLLKSSGFDILDNSAMEAIKRWVFVKRESVAYYFVEKTIIFQITK